MGGVGGGTPLRLVIMPVGLCVVGGVEGSCVVRGLAGSLILVFMKHVHPGRWPDVCD
jgi:hypothetical protein